MMFGAHRSKRYCPGALFGWLSESSFFFLSHLHQILCLTDNLCSQLANSYGDFLKSYLAEDLVPQLGPIPLQPSVNSDWSTGWLVISQALNSIFSQTSGNKVLFRALHLAEEFEERDERTSANQTRFSRFASLANENMQSK